MRTPALVIVGLLMISGLAWAYPKLELDLVAEVGSTG